jgi:ABC-type transport system involved in cytochrome c biogenesis permease subunit
MIATAAFILLLISLVMQTAGLLKRELLFSYFLLPGAALLLFATTAMRSAYIRFFAVTNNYESLLFFSGVIAGVIFLFRIRSKTKLPPLVAFVGTLVAIVLLAVASSPSMPKELLPPVPALRSHWLILHVTFSFIGEAFFVLAFSASIYYLAVRSDEKKQAADRLISTSIGIGYPVFTAGALIFGAIWAQYAWGSYWSWDPKETWALVTWIVYTGYIHTRFVRKLKGRMSALLSIVGFAFTMFTFFGVNFLMSGLHSYG